MGFRVEKIENEPIIVIYLTNPHTADEIPTIHEQTAQLAQTIDGTVYRIVDMAQLDWNFEQFQHAIEEGSKQREGGAADQRFKSYYAVGDKFLPRLIAHGLNKEQFGKLGVVAVATVLDAITQVRELLTTS